MEKSTHQFRETTFNTIDPKGRISIPSRFRDIIRVGGERVFVTRFDMALNAYTIDQWLEVEARIVALTKTSSKMRRFRRFFIGGAAECVCDKQGRILIPPILRQYAELKKDIVLIGQINHFQIWSRERWGFRQDRDFQMGYQHVSVMPNEVQLFLDPRPGDICVDATVGGAGHAKRICQSIQPGGVFVGLDRDRAAIDNAKAALSAYAPMARLFNNNFVDLPQILDRLKIGGVDGVVMDLGLSLHQIRSSGRGFSFQTDEPLDMRMDRRDDRTAAELVNRLPERELAIIFKRFGEERWADRIAKLIVAAREKAPVDRTGQLAEIVVQAIPKVRQSKRIHPATRVFMALRIAVNHELDCLAKFLGFIPDLLNAGGRLCMIAFHSLEDRMIKKRFNELAKGCVCPSDFPVCTCGRTPQVRLLTRKIVRPGQVEVEANPMARSAKLRALVRL